jgi:hypothetical protein
VDAVADVDIDLLDIARHLGVELHFLIRDELARNGECVGKGRAANLYDATPGGRVALHRCGGATRVSTSSRGNQAGHQQERGFLTFSRGGWATHFHIYPFRTSTAQIQGQ